MDKIPVWIRAILTRAWTIGGMLPSSCSSNQALLNFFQFKKKDGWFCPQAPVQNPSSC